jgi:hypothetical protein
MTADNTFSAVVMGRNWHSKYYRYFVIMATRLAY